MTSDFAAVPWYTSAEHYEEFRSTAIDRDDFFSTYQEWLTTALEHENQADKVGVVIIRIRLPYLDFKRWCETHQYPNSSQTRSQYAELLAERIVNWKND
jgi:hypothetical protein